MAKAARKPWFRAEPPDGLELALARLREGLAEDGLGGSTPQGPPSAPSPVAASPEPPSVAAETAPPSRERKRFRPVWAVLRFGLGAGLGLGAAAALFYLAVAPFIDPPLPSRPQPMSFVTADGVPLGVTRIGGRGRAEAKDAFGTRAEWPPVRIDELPDHVEGAVLAREDHRFRSHWGVRPESLAAAAAACAVRRVQGRACGRGASTIHMQVARGGFRDRPASAVDKLLEIPTALWIARRWTRDEVLERYLNDVYWGQELHGLNAAAWRYLRKRPAQLTLPESALLVGMLSSPNRTDPFADRTRARRERDEVLAAMARHGFISAAAAERARRTPLPVSRPQPKPETTQSRAFLRWVAPEALRRAEEGVQGVALSLDTRMQAAAYASVKRRLAARPELQASVVVMRPDGRVLALVGGRSETADTGRAALAQRSPASTAKLFTYAEALKRGWRPEDVISGAPVTVGDYTPRNYRGAHYGDLTLQQAWALSANTAAVRLNHELNPRRVAKLAARTGVTIPASAGAAAPLGAFEVDLLRLTAAYAGLIGNCAPVAPTGLATALDAGRCDPVLSRGAHQRLLQLMRSATAPGATGEAAGRSGLVVGGKTGTSAGNRDALFVGFLQAPRGPVVIGVWVGTDKGQPRGENTGGALPALIFDDLARTAASYRL